MTQTRMKEASTVNSLTEVLLHPEELWASRKREFWGKVMPYMRYVLQSGLGALMLFVLVAGTALYASFIEHIPPTFPIKEVALLLVAPAVAYTTYRTLLRPADLAFLLRIEHRMSGYMKRSVRYSLWPRTVLLIAVWCVLWPLYSRAEDNPKNFIFTLILLLMLKAVAAFGAWKERHYSDNRRRIAARYVRYLWACGATACWLWLNMPAALFVIGVSGLVYIGWLVTGRTLRFPWEAHFEAEKAHEGRVYLFLSGFVDLPATDERRYARPWLNFIGNRFALRKPFAYRYLLMKTLVRSELLGILLRLVIIGAVLLYWTNATEWSLLLYAAVVFVAGTQMGAVFAFHRHDVWQEVYPLPVHARHEAALYASTVAHALAAFALLLPIAVGPLSVSFKLAVIGSGVAIVLLTRWKRSKPRKDDED